LVSIRLHQSKYLQETDKDFCEFLKTEDLRNRITATSLRDVETVETVKKG